MQNGLSVLHMATQGGHVEVVKLLLERGYDIDDVTSVCSRHCLYKPNCVTLAVCLYLLRKFFAVFTYTICILSTTLRDRGLVLTEPR